MPIETYVRFRPVQPLDKSGGNAIARAKQRWSDALRTDREVVDFAFERGKIGTPKERSEVRDASVPPVDLTITWASLDAATRLFGDNARFEYLCGYVAGAPVVVVEGETQVMDSPA